VFPCKPETYPVILAEPAAQDLTADELLNQTNPTLHDILRERRLLHRLCRMEVVKPDLSDEYLLSRLAMATLGQIDDSDGVVALRERLDRLPKMLPIERLALLREIVALGDQQLLVNRTRAFARLIAQTFSPFGGVLRALVFGISLIALMCLAAANAPGGGLGITLLAFLFSVVMTVGWWFMRAGFRHWIRRHVRPAAEDRGIDLTLLCEVLRSMKEIALVEMDARLWELTFWVDELECCLRQENELAAGGEQGVPLQYS
jgi:hypothetical protein